MPDPTAEAREQRAQELTDAIEAATYPYRRCLEERHGLLKHNRDKVLELCKMDPDNRTFRAVYTALDSRLLLLNKAIDKYELREELDL